MGFLERFGAFVARLRTEPARELDVFRLVDCKICREMVAADTAHREGDGWIGECCWGK